jgi:plastocyanin
MAARAIFIARLTIVLAFIVIAFLAAWTRAARAGEAQVKINNFTFDPPVLKVKAGTAVTWINEDDIPHTVAADGRSFKSQPLDTDDKFSFAFTAPGRYTYFCSLHPKMTAAIIVEGASE